MNNQRGQPISVRLPENIRQWIKEKSQKNDRSVLVKQSLTDLIETTQTPLAFDYH